jgi:Tetratricopeptide repeat/Cytochrome c554 and c-prime
MLPRRTTLLGAAALIGVLGSVLVFKTRRDFSRASRSPLDLRSPYRNTRQGVKYVGDLACARCHATIAGTYRQHPMGRSLFPVAEAPQAGIESNGDRPLFDAQGFQYSIAHRDGRIFHQETRRDASGHIVARNEAEIQFVLGSGRQGFSYLIERNGFLFQSPISWYTHKQRWDLSPGYEQVNAHFDRPIKSACLFCHANQVEPVAGTLNRYEQPIFRGHAIGCERCHGPGELHITEPLIVAGNDMTIVNPAKLEPGLRDAVCEQCHLNGRRRTLRADRRDSDFRPGFPFYRFWTVLEPADGPAENRFVGQVEQMHESRCYHASRGRLGCISCHDPHRLPPVGEKTTYYRNRCLECHAERGCSLTTPVQPGRSPNNDCVACHMPRLRNTDVVHAATTDHRILRRGAEHDRSLLPDESTKPNQLLMVNFHRELMDDRERMLAQRDMGVILCRDGPGGAAIALPLLDQALRVQPDDLPAQEAKGFALGQLGRLQEASAAFQTVLTKEPDRESSLTGAGQVAAQAGRVDDAITCWRRAIAISPWRSDYHAELALLYFRRRNWRAVAEASRIALRLNPADLEIRKLLVRCYLRLGDPEAARTEFTTLLAFDPADRNDLLEQFAPLARPR